MAAADAPVDVAATWRRVRLPVLIAAGVVIVAVIAGAVASSPAARALDPRDASAHGGLALRRLLAARGVEVTPVHDLATATLGAGTSVLVPDPAALPAATLARLAAAGGTVVVLAPGERELHALGVDAGVRDDVFAQTVQPACPLPAATTAGDVRFEGLVYDAVAPTTCYPAGGGAGLVDVPTAGGRLVVWGSPTTFTNEHLGARGNAALALALLSMSPRLLWTLPQPLGTRAPEAARKSLVDLLPGWVVWSALQLMLAIVVVALWRARRLGPVVVEPLPVVVRAVETVEGRGRLLRAAKARGAAARALRAATVDRVVKLLSLGTDASRTTVVSAVAGRTRRAATDVEAVLYGADPTDDAALLALARHLDELEQTVRRS